MIVFNQLSGGVYNITYVYAKYVYAKTILNLYVIYNSGFNPIFASSQYCNTFRPSHAKSFQITRSYWHRDDDALPRTSLGLFGFSSAQQVCRYSNSNYMCISRIYIVYMHAHNGQQYQLRIYYIANGKRLVCTIQQAIFGGSLTRTLCVRVQQIHRSYVL